MTLLRMRLFLLLVVGIVLAAAEPVYVTAFRDPCTALEVHRLVAEGAVVAKLVCGGVDGDARERSLDGVAVALPGTPQVIHRYLLDGLVPGATYRLAFNGVEAARVRTVPGTMARPLRIATGGDTMHKPEWLAATARALAARDPDLVVLGGDLAYENGVKGALVVTWIKTWAEAAHAPDGRVLPFVACIGNHEVVGHYGGNPAKAPYFFAMLPLDGVAYHAVDVGPELSFLLLDTDHATRIPGAQTAWLAKALVDRVKRPTLIPVYHYPAWPTVKTPKGGSDPSDDRVSVLVRKHWVPLFEQAGVRVALENDQHTYKRTVPLLDGKPDPAGITYLGDGAWGVAVRKPLPTLTRMAKVDERRHGYLLTIAAGGRIGVEAIDEDGKVFDQVEIPAKATAP